MKCHGCGVEITKRYGFEIKIGHQRCGKSETFWRCYDCDALEDAPHIKIEPCQACTNIFMSQKSKA